MKIGADVNVSLSSAHESLVKLSCSSRCFLRHSGSLMGMVFDRDLVSTVAPSKSSE